MIPEKERAIPVSRNGDQIERAVGVLAGEATGSLRKATRTCGRRLRRLVDAYRVPGFRASSRVRGIFGDPKACVITLHRRSKKQYAAPVAKTTGFGTTGRPGGYASCRAAIGESIWTSRCAASTV